MPNWVKTRIKVSEKDFKAIKELCISEDKNGDAIFDFNKIDKMPTSLDIEDSSKGSDGIKLYMAKVNPDCHFYGTKADKLLTGEYLKLLEEVNGGLRFDKVGELTPNDFADLSKRYKGDFDDAISLGLKMISNIKKYDVSTWYDWSLNHWGTKWNADSCFIDEAALGATITFSTAWSFAEPVLLKLSKKLPKVVMDISYADEDMGNNAGVLTIANGKVAMGGPLKDGSAFACKLAIDIWECADSYFYDEKKKAIVCKDD